ncbi:hypothetical protein [uncultured Limimaricola sp.]|uniref:hypothetical protein n=1 Tax=uncultured Limimaricola sp. TaxID=2211667 RepID=UPI0030F4E0D7
MRHAMDFHGAVRIGTNLPDKRVFMNMRRMVAEIQAKNCRMPITDADRQTIADRLRVKLDAVKRMEPRIFVNDLAISHTATFPGEAADRAVANSGTFATEGGQSAVEANLDQREIMSRIASVVRANYKDRDLEIVQARLNGDMTREKFAALVDRHGISAERIRQIQRAALRTIREDLSRSGIKGMSCVSV